MKNKLFRCKKYLQFRAVQEYENPGLTVVPLQTMLSGLKLLSEPEFEQHAAVLEYVHTFLQFVLSLENKKHVCRTVSVFFVLLKVDFSFCNAVSFAEKQFSLLAALLRERPAQLSHEFVVSFAVLSFPFKETDAFFSGKGVCAGLRSFWRENRRTLDDLPPVPVSARAFLEATQKEGLAAGKALAKTEAVVTATFGVGKTAFREYVVSKVLGTRSRCSRTVGTFGPSVVLFHLDRFLGRAAGLACFPRLSKYLFVFAKRGKLASVCSNNNGLLTDSYRNKKTKRVSCLASRSAFRCRVLQKEAKNDRLIVFPNGQVFSEAALKHLKDGAQVVCPFTNARFNLNEVSTLFYTN